MCTTRRCDFLKNLENRDNIPLNHDLKTLNLKELFDLAYWAQHNNLQHTAFKLYNKIIEADPKSPEADKSEKQIGVIKKQITDIDYSV